MATVCLWGVVGDGSPGAGEGLSIDQAVQYDLLSSSCLHSTKSHSPVNDWPEVPHDTLLETAIQYLISSS